MKIKFDHTADGMGRALGIDPTRDKVLKEAISSAMARSIFDPEIKTLSQILELATNKAKNIQEVMFCVHATTRLYETLKQAMDRNKASAQDDLLEKAAQSSKTLGKYLN